MKLLHNEILGLKDLAYSVGYGGAQSASSLPNIRTYKQTVGCSMAEAFARATIAEPLSVMKLSIRESFSSPPAKSLRKLVATALRLTTAMGRTSGHLSLELLKSVIKVRMIDSIGRWKVDNERRGVRGAPACPIRHWSNVAE